MYIIAGQHKGKKISFSPSSKFRPTTAKVREAVFNILIHNNLFPEEGKILDLFCGSGAYGLESLSRGAGSVLMIDSSTEQVSITKQNIAHCKEEERARILQMDCTRLPPASEKFDLVFLDPPYFLNLVPKTLENLVKNNWLAAENVIVVETEEKYDLPELENFELLLMRQYSKSKIYIISFKQIN